MLKVIDNFVTNTYAEVLETMCESELVWRLEDNISGIDYKKFNAPGANFDGPQYGFYYFALNSDGVKSPVFDKVLPLLYSLEEKTGITVKEVYRIRIALSTTVGKEVQHHPHVDEYTPHKVLLYYVNDSDGDTFIFNETYSPGDEEFPSDFTLKERVSPKKGRAIVFDGLTYHNSSKPVNNTARYIINIDFN